jgi:hypothetical protein
MGNGKDTVFIKVEYPKPRMPVEKEEELKVRLRSAMVLFFPELYNNGDLAIIVQPRANGPHKNV